jgi:hypothetical protein
MQENVQQSPVLVLLKKIWPFINKILNAVFYFLISLIKSFFKNAITMIKGG